MVTVDMGQVRQRKRDIVDSFRNSNLRRIEQAKGLTLLMGEARFTGPKQVEVRETPPSIAAPPPDTGPARPDQKVSPDLAAPIEVRDHPPEMAAPEPASEPLEPTKPPKEDKAE